LLPSTETELYQGQGGYKPFLYPLRTASGKKVSRAFPVEPLPSDPIDHPHQKGLWIGAEHLSGMGLPDMGLPDMDFWETDASYHRPHMGKIVFKDVLNTKAGEGEGSFTILADWVSLEGEPVLAETRTMTFYSTPRDCRMFDVDLRLRAKRELTFEDHHDAVIGMRLAPAFDEGNGGQPVNAQGLEGEAHTRGQRSEWVDWQAELEGEKVGVALMDHPSNFAFPTRWHIRGMGLLVASPFAQHDYSALAPDGGKTLHAGEELRLRYRVLIHPAPFDVAAIYKEFAAK
jgi:hypothetical protein